MENQPPKRFLKRGGEMDDLALINLKLAEFAVGKFNQAQRDYLTYLPRCIGRLRIDIKMMRHLLSEEGASAHNSIEIISVNKNYLHYLRVVSLLIKGGQFHRLLEINIDWEMAIAISNLTGAQIMRLATLYQGCLADIDLAFFKADFAACIASHHATAAITGQRHRYAAHP